MFLGLGGDLALWVRQKCYGRAKRLNQVDPGLRVSGAGETATRLGSADLVPVRRRQRAEPCAGLAGGQVQRTEPVTLISLMVPEPRARV